MLYCQSIAVGLTPDGKIISISFLDNISNAASWFSTSLKAR